MKTRKAMNSTLIVHIFTLYRVYPQLASVPASTSLHSVRFGNSQSKKAGYNAFAARLPSYPPAQTLDTQEVRGISEKGKAHLEFYGIHILLLTIYG